MKHHLFDFISKKYLFMNKTIDIHISDVTCDEKTVTELTFSNIRLSKKLKMTIKIKFAFQNVIRRKMIVVEFTFH